MSSPDFDESKQQNKKDDGNETKSESFLTIVILIEFERADKPIRREVNKVPEPHRD